MLLSLLWKLFLMVMFVFLSSICVSFAVVVVVVFRLDDRHPTLTYVDHCKLAVDRARSLLVFGSQCRDTGARYRGNMVMCGGNPHWRRTVMSLSRSLSRSSQVHKHARTHLDTRIHTRAHTYTRTQAHSQTTHRLNGGDSN